MSDTVRPEIAPFFWLHIKKSAGGSIRRLMAPHYVSAERVRKPVNFLQAPRAQHNDILNNFRIPLGDLQFRRALFARTYLYPNEWQTLPRFAVARAPIDRCLSAFFYLQGQPGGERSFVQYLQDSPKRTAPTALPALFDAFLDLIEEAQSTPSIYTPVNLHFTTHVAPMWPDVTDTDGTLLLSHIFRLDSLRTGLNHIRALCDLPPLDDAALPQANRSPRDRGFCPSADQRRRIEQLYEKDFDLYEQALHL